MEKPIVSGACVDVRELFKFIISHLAASSKN